ncbi:triose-phosphate isomerase [Gilvimarinus sp. DA14]|uniref:triose-phosphate isomerase n=1 Tax=Gilvimarinus sp. DA14 TaxID=2956798 RepID=UPI0020B8CF9C|nr:triose-phosphate isomerase [Gilvimarinus sp. DA14]UTF59714.1 triose-phosphate isomerase [Gilvimarinus sp. DA14]
MTSQPRAQRRRLVVGNWKMNGTRDANSRLLQEILSNWKPLEKSDAAICPPFVYLEQVAQALSASQLYWGGQSVNPNDSGAYTGEISAKMLIDQGCRYVIVGHNERRRLQSESDDYVARQFVAAQAEGLIPILCVGESSEQREQGKALETIGRQLQAVLDIAGLQAFATAIVAYEPIWAVGTGITATPEEAAQVHAFIRKQFASLGHELVILYGGSVKPENAAELFAKEDIDGALLGGASLQAKDFIAICQSAEVAGK